MGLPVKVSEVVTQMDLPSEAWSAYLHRRTGEFVTVTGDDVLGLDSEDEDRDLLIEGIESEDYAPLPDSFEIHEWDLMRRFCLGIADESTRQELLDAIHGRGAFRLFRAIAERLGHREDWYRFRQRALERIAIDWLESEGIPYELDTEDPSSAGS